MLEVLELRLTTALGAMLSQKKKSDLSGKLHYYRYPRNLRHLHAKSSKDSDLRQETGEAREEATGNTLFAGRD